MKVLKFIPFFLLIACFSCSKDEGDVDAFIGNWELSHFTWIDCENSGTDNSVDIAIPSGGCYFDGCISLQVLESGMLIISEYDEGDTDTYDYEMPYTYDQGNHSISIQDEDDEFEGLYTAQLLDGELVVPFKEDGCDTEFKFRKL